MARQEMQDQDLLSLEGFVDGLQEEVISWQREAEAYQVLSNAQHEHNSLAVLVASSQRGRLGIAERATACEESGNTGTCAQGGEYGESLPCPNGIANV